MSKILAAVCASLLQVVASGAQAQQAQEPNSTPAASTGWRVECGNTGQALDCRVVRQVQSRENQQLVVVVAIRVTPDTKKPVALIQVPLGILVPENVTMRIDDAQPEKFAIQTCTQQGCFAGAPLSEAMMKGMLSGRELKVGFNNLNRQGVTVTMPLAGFPLAYDKIK